jgi:phosphomannomutase
VRYLLDTVPDAAARGIAIARDGRHRSDVFQRDAAAVAAAVGVRVHWLAGATPTPVLAYAVKRLGAAAGVVITASHNPPAYNGYKVYWHNGAQIVPPVDTAIATAIEAAPPASEIARDEDSAKIETVRVETAYRDAVAALALAPETDVSPLRIAYSALHGVGQPTFLEVMRRRGFEHVFAVSQQAEPDGDFPTVSFPNPEEPGALDLVLALADAKDCSLVLVNDPDADRLGAAVRARDGRFVTLSGNDIGTLLAFYILSHTPEPKPLVVSTLVSTRMVQKMCSVLGVRYADTLTGFKWIANEAMRIETEEGCRFVFGFEEALGYAIGSEVRDKDGISAALVLAEMAAGLAAEGRTLLDELERLRERFGRYVNRQTSFTLTGAEGAVKIREAIERLHANERTSLASLRFERHVRDGVLIYDLEDGGRVAVRPSGTEPKLKFYLEAVGSDATARLDAVEADILRAAGLEQA